MNGEFLVIQCADKTGVEQGLQAVAVHDRAVCKDRSIPCCIHNPSSHIMISFPLHWRDDIKAMERICPHGLCHPDPDHIAYVRYAKGYAKTTHTCDGCCGF